MLLINACSWKTNPACHNTVEQVMHPCYISIRSRREAEDHCSALKDDVFVPCHSMVSPEEMYQNCLHDICTCEGPISMCLCPILATYSDLCANQNMMIDWRQNISECGIHCPTGQEYKICGDSCTYSCASMSISERCTSKCAEGCSCPEGHALDEHGDCVLISKCPCFSDDTFYEPGSVKYDPETENVCTCHSGKWDCQPANAQQKKIVPTCDRSLHKVLEMCPKEPVTCRNMHFAQREKTECLPDCVCKSGYVKDKDGKCILPKQCPCHHGGKSYNNEETIMQKCNTW